MAPLDSTLSLHPLELFLSDPQRSPIQRDLACAGEMVRFDKNQLVMQHGTLSDQLFLVLQGRLKSFRKDTSGKTLTFGSFGVGECAGLDTLDQGPWTHDLMAQEPTFCISITRQQVMSYLVHHPQSLPEVTHCIARQSRMAMEQACGLAFLDVYERTVRVLTSLAVNEPDRSSPIAEQEALTHQEIANRVGCSREMVSRIFKDLIKGGYISIDNRLITLKKPLPSKW